MANLIQTKARIRALEKTSSITKSLYHISSSKIKGMQEALTQYFNFLKQFNIVLVDAAARVSEHALITENKKGKIIYMLITSDRGLAGSYHNALFKSFLEETKHLDKKDYLVFVIGKKGYSFAKKRDLPMINQRVISNRDDFTTYLFKNETKIVLDAFLEGTLKEVILYYNHFVNRASNKVRKERILPIPVTKKVIEARKERTYTYDVKPLKILEETALMYVEIKMTGALIAKLAEHSARVQAIKQATDNAKEVTDKLKLYYNRTRQQAITNELIDISNGANI